MVINLLCIINNNKVIFLPIFFKSKTFNNVLFSEHLITKFYII